MTRKLKVKIDKNKKKIIDNLYEFYLNSLDRIVRRTLDKKVLEKIYKAIEHYNDRKFRYLAFDSLVVSITKIEEYLKKDVAFTKEIGFEKYLKLSEELAKDIGYDFNMDVLNRGVLEAMSINFFRYVINAEVKVEYITTDLTEDYPYKLSNVKEFTKDVICKSKDLDVEFLDKEETVLVTLESKKNNSYKYLELRKLDYNFMEDIAKILKIMNLLLRTVEVEKEEIVFIEKYKDCIYNLQRITDYLYFKQILQLSYDKIPNYIIRYLKIKNVA
ncbi:MAG: hypothetical protein ACRCYA_01655 [Cetobacterium sp.]|uniref:hypothetical protein n=1 Tax=Cetobacterium sp. TaxID=2071632 RepID=UPI003F364759